MSKNLIPLARELYLCLGFDIFPSPVACLNFGIQTSEHFGALQWAVLREDVDVEQLEAACGDGEKLNALVSPSSPYRGVRFHVACDAMRMDDGPTEADDGDEPF